MEMFTIDQDTQESEMISSLCQQHTTYWKPFFYNISTGACHHSQILTFILLFSLEQSLGGLFVYCRDQLPESPDMLQDFLEKIGLFSSQF